MENLAPIVLFTYNRLWHTRQTIESLQKNQLSNNSELFIYSDGAKDKESWQKVNETRDYLKTINGFKNITLIFQEKNIGLSNSIISGVTRIVNEYGKVIVLEDDMITSTYFLKYMNENLNLYKNEETIASIHGYRYPIPEIVESDFFLKGADCWGWATWKNKWKQFNSDGKKLLNQLKKENLEYEFDFNGKYPFTKMLENQVNGKINSWAIRWYASSFLNNLLTLYPKNSYVQNIGFDNSGEHCGITNKFLINLEIVDRKFEKLKIKECVKNKKYFGNYLQNI